MIRLFLLYAILIFAKKAPQLIKVLMNIKGDNIGLKGLSIKNKMGEAALVGGAVKKGMNSIEGKTKGAIGGAAGGLVRGGAAGFMSTTGLKNRLKAAGKTAKDAGLAGVSKGFAKGKHDAAQNGNTKGIFGGAYKEMGDIASGGRTSLFNKPKEWLQQQEDKFTKGVPGKDNRFANPLTAENQIKLNGLKADLTKRYGAAKANEMLKRAISRTENTFGVPLNLSDEKQWKFLAEGKEWNGSAYEDSRFFKGINHAIDNTQSNYTFDYSVAGTMNEAYRLANISTNIDKKRSAFDAADQKYQSALMNPNISDDVKTAYADARKAAFKKYIESLSLASTAGVINGSFVVAGLTINGHDMEHFVANTGGVDTKLSKQVSAFKSNADSAVQKEEIKQKTDSDKK